MSRYCLRVYSIGCCQRPPADVGLGKGDADAGECLNLKVFVLA